MLRIITQYARNVKRKIIYSGSLTIYERKELMKFFINFKLPAIISDEEKEKNQIEAFERMSKVIKEFCKDNRAYIHCVSLAIWEAMYNSFLHGQTPIEIRMKVHEKLFFLIKDGGDFYYNKEIKEAIKNKDLEKLRNFKPHEKSCGNGFEIIFESKPKIKILKGALCLIWEKACGQ